MPSVSLVAVGRLDEYRGVAEALSEHFAANVVEADALADVATRLLHDRIAVHVGQQAQAEALRIARIGEAIHRDRRLRRVERFTDTRVQLVVADRAPESRFAVHDGLSVDRRARRHPADVHYNNKPNLHHREPVYRRFYAYFNSILQRETFDELRARQTVFQESSPVQIYSAIPRSLLQSDLHEQTLKPRVERQRNR